MESRVLSQLLMSIMEDPYYDSLRTQQQLGYLVFSGVKIVEGVRYGLRRVRSYSRQYRVTRAIIQHAPSNGFQSRLVPKLGMGWGGAHDENGDASLGSFALLPVMPEKISIENSPPGGVLFYRPFCTVLKWNP